MTPALHAPQISAYSGPRKAAAFLMGIGETMSAELLKQLTPSEVRAITAEISATRTVGSEELAAVFGEFETLVASGRLFATGGPECARRLVEQAFGASSVPRLMAPAQDAEPSMGEIFEASDPKQLAQLVRNEHPQTVAVLLSSMSADYGSRFLRCLPEDRQQEVALRLASLDRVSPEAFEKITSVIGSKLKNFAPTASADGVKLLAAILNQTPPERTEAILGFVAGQSQTLADSVKSTMFVFEDVLTLDKQSMTALVAKLDRKVLTMALKGSGQKMREQFAQCMSQRASEMLSEDMEALGPVRIRDVKSAQAEIIAALRQLQQAGVISTGGGSDEYVV